MAKTFHVLGYDIGGTKLAIGLATGDGRIIGEARLPNKDTRPEDILPQLVRIGRRLVADAGLKMPDVRAFGISAPYPADPVNGVLTKPTNNPLWIDVPIKRYLEEELGIPGAFENDANCGALAEWFFGAGRGCTDFIYLTMSTGIGGGIVAADRLVRGKGFYAGEVGHIVIQAGGELCGCGLRGCFEAYCGGRPIALRIQRELAGQPDHPLISFAGGRIEDIDMIALEKGVRAGDEYSVGFWAEMCERNAQGLGILLNTFNPQKLILGTFAWAIGDLFLEPIKQSLPKYAWEQMIRDCEIVPSELRRDIGYYAGCAAALNYLREAGE